MERFQELWSEFSIRAHQIFDNLLSDVITPEQLLLVWPIWVISTRFLLYTITRSKNGTKFNIEDLMALDFNQLKLIVRCLIAFLVRLAVFASFLALSWFSCYASRVH
jgi:hypothetical protein